MYKTIETFAVSISGFLPNYQPVWMARAQPFAINELRRVFMYLGAQKLDIAPASPEIQEHPSGTWHRTFPGAADWCLVFNGYVSSECFGAAKG